VTPAALAAAAAAALSILLATRPRRPPPPGSPPVTQAPPGTPAPRERIGARRAPAPTPLPGIGAGSSRTAARIAGVMSGPVVYVAAAGLGAGGAARFVAALAAAVATTAGLRRLPSSTGVVVPPAEVALAAELLAQAFLSGAPPVRATRAAARAAGGLAGESLDRVAGALDLGLPAAQAWALLGSTPFAAVARRMARSSASGSPVADQLHRLAARTRATEHAKALAGARAAGVRAVLPLGAFFLPAFLLLAVVPALISGVRGLSV
jgi:hypothetical protein